MTPRASHTNQTVKWSTRGFWWGDTGGEGKMDHGRGTEIGKGGKGKEWTEKSKEMKWKGEKTTKR